MIAEAGWQNISNYIHAELVKSVNAFPAKHEWWIGLAGYVTSLQIFCVKTILFFLSRFLLINVVYLSIEDDNRSDVYRENWKLDE